MFLTDSVVIGRIGIFLIAVIVSILVFLYWKRKHDVMNKMSIQKILRVIFIIALILGFILSCMFLVTYCGIYDLLPEDVFIEKTVMGSLLLICFVFIIVFWRSMRKQRTSHLSTEPKRSPNEHREDKGPNNSNEPNRK